MGFHEKTHNSIAIGSYGTIVSGFVLPRKLIEATGMEDLAQQGAPASSMPEASAFSEAQTLWPQ